MRRLAFCLIPMLALAQPVPDKRAALEKLLDALATAPTEQAAASLEEKIAQGWVGASTPAVTLLMARGLRDLAAGAHADAVTVFDDAIVLDPGLAEAWHQRASAKFMAGDAPGAVRDIQEALRLEPRHFGAWRTLEQVAEGREDWKAAYSARKHLLDIDPRSPGGAARLKDLKRKAFGDAT